LSLRPDLIPIDYVKEFEKVQDNVQPMDYEEARNIIELELKKPIRSLFKEVNSHPIVSDSIAQVYRAKLLDGKDVAIKVQRAKIKDIMQRDINLMNLFAQQMEKQNYKIKGLDPVLIIEEFKKWTERELDFENEASNIQMLRKNFAKDKITLIPEMYRDYCTKKVLVIELIDGIKLDETEKLREKGYNIHKVMKNCFDSVLKQVFIDGFFYADPHPANITVLGKERISFVDFDIVGRFDEKMRHDAIDLVSGIIKNDISLITIALFSLGMESTDIEIIKIDLEKIINPLQGAELKDIVISKAIEDILTTIQRYGFRIPLDFVLFGKTIMTLEESALKYDPEFKITVEAKPFVEKLIKQKRSTKQILNDFMQTTSKLKDFTKTIPGKTSNLMTRMKETDVSLKYIDRDMKSMIREMDSSSNRITFGLIITALMIASTIMLSYNQIKIMGMSAFSFVGYSLSALLILIIVISMLKEKKRF
jgi:ubiquinone biosynthesis protein